MAFPEVVVLKMRVLLLLIFSLVVCSLIEGDEDEFYEARLTAADPNHLVPPDPLDDYFQLLSSKLFVTRGDVGRFVVKDSHKGEISFAAYSKEDIDIENPFSPSSSRAKFPIPEEILYFVTVTKPTSSLYQYSKNEKIDSEIIKIERYDKKISKELAVAIQRAWARVLHLTKVPAESHSGGGGISYQFSAFVKNLGDLHGEAWSPSDGITYELVNLGYLLIEFVLEDKITEETLITKLKAFELTVPVVEKAPVRIEK